MTAPPTSPGKLPGYDLSEPTEADAVAALTRVFGSARALEMWAGACRAALIPVGDVRTSELERVADSLAKQGNACAAVARSMKIRLGTYAKLSARRAALAQGDGR